MSNFRKPQLTERFQNDAAFNHLVKSLEQMIIHHGFTPSELREALFLAHYRYEMDNTDQINKRMLEFHQFYQGDKVKPLK